MKVTQALAQPLQGVSQQEPHERREGQVAEQVNMIPDPVLGLTRRRGTRWVTEKLLDADMLNEDPTVWRRLEYAVAGQEYVLLIRRAPRDAPPPEPGEPELCSAAGMSALPGSTVPGCAYPSGRTGSVVPLSSPPIIAFNKTTETLLDVVGSVSDGALGTLYNTGASAATAVGRYVFLAANGAVATATRTEAGDGTSRGVVWVRAGAYSRTYTVSCRPVPGAIQKTFSYTTPSAAYPGRLDTSGVPLFVKEHPGSTTTATEIAFVLAKDLSGTMAYRAELTYYLWDITGLTIEQDGVPMTAVSSAAALVPGTFYFPPSHVVGPPPASAQYVYFHSSTVGSQGIVMTYTHTKVQPNPNYTRQVAELTNEYQAAQAQWIIDAAAAIAPNAIAQKLMEAAVAEGIWATDMEVIDGCLCMRAVAGLTAEDGGDGTLVRAVGGEVSASENVSPVHFVGTAGKPHVVRVRPSNQAESFYLQAESTGPLSTLGFSQVRWVEGAGSIASITGGLFYGTAVANTFYVASSAAALQALTGPTTPEHPAWAPSTVGDADSSPTPYFVGQTISMLAVFQDRLLIGAGGVLACSRTGDYLNFFRESALTLTAADAIEMYAQGASDDILRNAVLYYKDLVIFGDRQQYMVSGRVPLSPVNAAMPVLAAHDDAAPIPPVTAGRAVFYAKSREDGGNGGVAQLEPGDNEGNPDSFDISTQLDSYIGDACELAHVGKPTTLLVRTAATSDIKVFSYLDRPNGRAQDAWHTFRFAPTLGPVLGMSPHDGGLYVFHLRTSESPGGDEEVRAVVDFLPFSSALDSRPYLDSQRPLSTVRTGTTSLHAGTVGPWYAAKAGALVGYPLAQQAFATNPADYYVGADFAAYTTFTNPFFKDGNDRPVMTGRDVVSSILVAYKNTAGFKFDVLHKNGTVLRTEVFHPPGPAAGTKSCAVLRANVDFSYTISAVNWLPLSAAPVAWTGQIYHRPQRL